MTKSEMYLHDLAFLGPGLLFLNQYFNSFIDEYLVLWVALVSQFTFINLGGKMAERLGSQVINQKVVGSIPGRAK